MDEKIFRVLGGVGSCSRQMIKYNATGLYLLKNGIAFKSLTHPFTAATKWLTLAFEPLLAGDVGKITPKRLGKMPHIW